MSGIVNPLLEMDSIDMMLFGYFFSVLGYYAWVFLSDPWNFLRQDTVNYGKTRPDVVRGSPKPTDPKKKTTSHGGTATPPTTARNKWQVSKNNFFYFYLSGAFYCLTLLPVGFNTITEQKNMMILFHLIRRMVETCVFPFSPTSTMHAGVCLMGLTYYLTIVLAISRSSIVRFTWSHLIVFFFAQALQFATILTTSRLRGPKLSHVPLADLSILFRWVLCPHFLGECIIYAVLADISGWYPLLALNVLFVVLNQIITGVSTRQWYLRRFPNAFHRPKSVIPFII